MPKSSLKKKAECFFDQLIMFNLMEMEVNGEDTRLDEMIDLFNDFFIVYNMYRYNIPHMPNSIPKSQKFLLEIVPKLDEDRFKVLFRMSRSTFGKLLKLIENDRSFRYKGKGPKQAPVIIQLQIVLFRLGCSISLSRIAFLFGVCDGGTVGNFTNRVFCAIMKHRSKLIAWPKPEERNIIQAETYHEMPYCIGYVDGTEIKLTDAPCEDPDAYISRKQVHSVKVQIVSDYKLRIRSMITGYPGSCHDSRIYNQCKLSTNPDQYFNQGQYLLADSAYRLTNTVITPFRQNCRRPGTSTDRKNFNKRLSRYRVRAENTIGGLKERFESLKDLRIRILDKASSIFLCDWITVCGIVYNFILIQNNNADYIRYEEVLAYEDRNDSLPEINNEVDGEEKRSQIMNYLFNCN